MMADFDLSSILNSLSADDMDNIKKLASDFLGGSNTSSGGGTAEKTERTPAPQITDELERSLGGLPDLSLLTSIAPILQAVNRPDDRVQFINALRPLLSDERKGKADEAINLLRLLSVIPLLQERGMM